jgi:hypothetical protein
MLSTIAGGISGYQESRTAAKMAEFSAKQEMLAGEDRALAIRRERLKAVAANRVAFSASGIDIAAGTPAWIEEALESEAESGVAREMTGARLRAAQARAVAAAHRSQGLMKLVGAAGKAGSTGLDYGIDIAKRG